MPFKFLGILLLDSTCFLHQILFKFAYFIIFFKYSIYNRNVNNLLQECCNANRSRQNLRQIQASQLDRENHFYLYFLKWIIRAYLFSFCLRAGAFIYSYIREFLSSQTLLKLNRQIKVYSHRQLHKQCMLFQVITVLIRKH